MTPPLAGHPSSPTETNTHSHSLRTLGREGVGAGLPIDRVLVPLQGVVDSGSHTGRHDIGVRGVSAVVLRGVKRRPVVQVVNRGDRPRRVGVSVHGSRHPYSVHPAVMGQLIVLSEAGRGAGGAGVRAAGRAEGGEGKKRGEGSERRSGEGTERDEGGESRGKESAEEGAGGGGRGKRERKIQIKTKSEVPSTS